MNQKRGVATISESCRRKNLNRILEKYIKSCRAYGSEQDTEQNLRAGKKGHGRFPNIAGFCGFYCISIDDLENLAKEFPDEISHLYVILEDEALNSGLPPAVLSAYLKKRLGYDDRRTTDTGELNVRFEHDIFNDGE